MPPAPPAHKRAGWKWLALLCALWAGLAVGFLVAFSCGASFSNSLVANELNLLLLPVIVAAWGPAILVICGAFAFHVHGTWVAIGAGVVILLLYAALILGIDRWWKTESPRARLFGWLALASYTALVTFCLSCIAPSI